MTSATLERPRVAAATGPATRYRLRFPSREAMEAALAIEASGAPAVINRKRGSISVQLEPAGPAAMALESFAATAPPVSPAQLRGVGGDRLAAAVSAMDPPMAAQALSMASLAANFGAQVVEDYQYQLEELDFFDPNAFQPEDVAAASLTEMTQLIRATDLWPQTRGANVIIAVVDTGVDGSRPEFPAARRSPHSWAPQGDSPWTDWQGHGSMCASIAAGSAAGGGAFDGVAPDATIMSCKTHFYDTELAAIYDVLSDLARDGNVVVATNSFGLKTGTPPPVPQDSEFAEALDEAVGAGVYVCFSAGNYHQLAGGGPNDDRPNSIWLHKSRADVLSVGACKPDNAMWFYSSRGPGQFFNGPNTNEKPDVVAPTPPNGRVLFGGQVVSLPDGWGTSGCCPQVAGVAALLLSARPGTPRVTLFDAIRASARPLGNARRSEGAGMVDGLGALGRI